ncbi:MAG: hypothetical protein HFE39_07515 [Clostridiales bacterium]|jgi:hypothetical protein|nr:hypothetical protein [Clostridiales bacterium]
MSQLERISFFTTLAVHPMTVLLSSEMVIFIIASFFAESKLGKRIENPKYNFKFMTLSTAGFYPSPLFFFSSSKLSVAFFTHFS